MTLFALIGYVPVKCALASRCLESRHIDKDVILYHDQPARLNLKADCEVYNGVIVTVHELRVINNVALGDTTEGDSPAGVGSTPRPDYEIIMDVDVLILAIVMVADGRGIVVQLEPASRHLDTLTRSSIPAIISSVELYREMAISLGVVYLDALTVHAIGEDALKHAPTHNQILHSASVNTMIPDVCPFESNVLDADVGGVDKSDWESALRESRSHVKATAPDHEVIDTIIPCCALVIIRIE